MSTILIGTSGYSYTDWIGPVYRKGTKQEDFLIQYARMFPTVELNFSYYRMPEATYLEAMHKKAPMLQFSIKAHQSLTHTIDPVSWKDQATLFCRALEPLVENKVLSAVLLQFPFSFHYEIAERKYLDALLKTLRSFPVAVEFRNSHWYNNRTLDSLRERNVTLASLDLPSVKGNPPMMDIKTSNSLAYLRFHGRNEETWWGSDSASRYDYLYTKKELSNLLERIRLFAKNIEKVIIYFNNHHRGQAVANALMLYQMAEGGGLCAHPGQVSSISM
ncbi:MAG: DUF72 domain-containing protein [Sphaerochaetaceae bacterium]